MQRVHYEIMVATRKGPQLEGHAQGGDQTMQLKFKSRYQAYQAVHYQPHPILFSNDGCRAGGGQETYK